MGDSMFEVNYKPGEEVTLRFRLPCSGEIAPGARNHAREAGREVLVSLRSLLDEVIEVLEDKKEGKGEQEGRRR